MMRNLCYRKISLSVCVFLLACSNSTAATGYKLNVAVAANFMPTATQLAQLFEQRSGYTVQLSSGSTGKLYAQIMQGAPYDIFLAADSRRPALLERKGLIGPGQRLTYALGRLALWSKRPDFLQPEQLPAIERITHFAIANPRLAPYGKAAQQTLMNMGRWQALQAKLVMGENISQAFQFVASGNAELGLVAYSQLQGAQAPRGSFWLVPADWHEPIEQQAAMLKDNPGAAAFMMFLQSVEARRLIQKHGYTLAEN